MTPAVLASWNRRRFLSHAGALVAASALSAQAFSARLQRHRVAHTIHPDDPPGGAAGAACSAWLQERFQADTAQLRRFYSELPTPPPWVTANGAEPGHKTVSW